MPPPNYCCSAPPELSLPHRRCIRQLPPSMLTAAVVGRPPLLAAAPQRLSHRRSPAAHSLLLCERQGTGGGLPAGRLRSADTSSAKAP